MKYVDEEMSPIAGQGGKPDWGEWAELRVEYEDFPDGGWETLKVCRRLTEPEKAARREAERSAAMSAQAPAALALFVRSAGLDDGQALKVEAFYPDWTVGASYSTGDVVRHGGGLWRALQDSVGQEQYPPDSFVAGWKRVGEPEGGAFPWSQPLGATDAYMKGDRVTHNGRTWVSTVDSNVWEPGVYGWEEAAA